MEWNLICLWMVAATCGLNLLTALRASPPAWGYAGVSAMVLAITGGWFAVRPHQAGLIGGGLMLALIVAPALLQRLTLRYTVRQRFDLARWPATAAGLLHPFDGINHQARLIRALDLADRGDTAGADALLATLQNAPPRVARSAELHRCRVGHRWDEWVAKVDARGGLAAVRRDAGLLGGYVRGLGEIGRLSDMLQAAAGQRISTHAALATSRAIVRLNAFVFAGQPGRAAELLAGPLAGLPPATAALWLGTAELAAGNRAAADVQFDDALSTGTAATRAAVAHRRAHPPVVAAAMLTPVDQLVLDKLHVDADHDQRFSPAGPGPPPWVTWGLVAANVAVFAVEAVRGGPADDSSTRYGDMLDRMGGLSRDALTRHEYWRLLAANFLHFGTAHLTLNMLALLALGPMVERSLGPPAFLALYLLSGMAAVATAAALQRDPAELLVGASGAIMALIGASAAVLARGWFRERAAAAARRLRVLLVIILAQATFDHFTPQVSGSAHLAGAAYGFVLASLVPHRMGRRPGPDRGFPVVAIER